MVSLDCYVALPYSAMGWVCLLFVIVIFLDHTHYFCEYVTDILKMCMK